MEQYTDWKWFHEVLPKLFMKCVKYQTHNLTTNWAIDGRRTTRTYTTHFYSRQQAKHLGIIIRDKREYDEEVSDRDKREVAEKPISVHIHKLNKTRLNGDQKIQVLYHVSVDGKPVPAVTAAGDMRYVTDEEVRDVLGYPFLIKAERKY